MALPRKNTEPSGSYNPTPSSGNDNMQPGNIGASNFNPSSSMEPISSIESQRIEARDAQNRANWAVFWVVVVLAAIGAIYAGYSQKWFQQNSAVANDNNMAASDTNGNNANNNNATPASPAPSSTNTGTNPSNNSSMSTPGSNNAPNTPNPTGGNGQ